MSPVPDANALRAPDRNATPAKPIAARSSPTAVWQAESIRSSNAPVPACPSLPAAMAARSLSRFILVS